MKLIRDYFVILLLAGFPAMTHAQEESVLTESGIESAKDGIEYWNNEAGVSKIFGKECSEITNSQLQTCRAMIASWTDELSRQVGFAETILKNNRTSFLHVDRYLKFAKRLSEKLKQLYEINRTHTLKFIINGLDAAIKIAEKILSLIK